MSDRILEFDDEIITDNNESKNQRSNNNISIGFTVEEKVLFSEYLERDVIIDAYIPLNAFSAEGIPLLFVNDGQDLRTMNFKEIIESSILLGAVEPIVVIGIHCGADRMNEYGIIHRTDFMGRGAKAGLYSRFILDELLPFIKETFPTASIKEKAFAGFSLGALSAIDIVWNYPEEFKKAGVFSGALWWRRHGYDDEKYNEQKDKIMHLQVQKGKLKQGLKFFFECGKLDETADRNNNGIIDSIEDTTDLIRDLKNIGYSEADIHYLELEDGEHNVPTWGRAFPEFLKWGWGTGK